MSHSSWSRRGVDGGDDPRIKSRDGNDDRASKADRQKPTSALAVRAKCLSFRSFGLLVTDQLD
jgi:hypothetical protein